MVRTWSLLALALLAGCGGFGAPDAPGARTPAWHADAGVDADALAERHASILRANGSYTRFENETLLVNGTPVADSSRRPAGVRPPVDVELRANLTAGRYRRIVTNDTVRRERFVGPTVVASRRVPRTAGDATAVAVRRRGGAALSPIERVRNGTAADALASSLAAWDFTPAGYYEREGRRRYRYLASRRVAVETGDVPAGDGRVRANARLVVTDAGLVRRFRVAYYGSATVAGTRVNVTRIVTRRYAAVGETPAARPSWVDRAANAS